MTREEILGCTGQIGIVPGVRVPEKELVLFAAETLYEAGIPIVEIMMTVPDAVGVIGRGNSTDGERVHLCRRLGTRDPIGANTEGSATNPSEAVDL